MSRRVALFLGNARTGEFEALRRSGVAVGLIRDVTSHGPCAPDESFDVVVPWRPRDGVRQLPAALAAAAPGADIGLLNLREAYVEHYAALCAELGIPTVSPADVRALRSKGRMHALFRTHIGPHAVARSAPADTADDVVAFGDQHGWPVILKPTMLYSSLYVLSVIDPEHARTTFPAIREGVDAHVAAKGLRAEFRGLQVEEYLSGSNHSIDLVVDRTGMAQSSPPVDVVTGADLGTGDFHHFARFTPTRLSEQTVARMDDLARAAVAALKLRGCAAHVEFIATAQGPRILEVGIRPGGHRITMLREGYGIDFPSGYLAAVTGSAVPLRESSRRPYAIVTPFADSDGRFAGLAAVERITALPSYLTHSVIGENGHSVGSSVTGHWQVLVIELSHPDMRQVEADVETISRLRDLVLVD